MLSGCIYYIDWDKVTNKTNQTRKDKKNKDMEMERHQCFFELGFPISPQNEVAVPSPPDARGENMEMEYKEEGGFIVMKAGGEMPEELFKIIRAMEILIQESNMEKNMK